MLINKDYVCELIEQNQWSNAHFAKVAQVSPSTVCRWLKGERGEGRNLISGVIKAFPNEPLDKLFHK